MPARTVVTRAAVTAPPPPMPRTRERVRAINIEAAENPRAVMGSNSVTAEMKDFAKEYFLANQIANAAKAKADKARKALLKAMKADEVTSFEHTLKDPEGNRYIVDVAIETPETSYIDVIELKKLVKPDVFEKIISATKSSVETHAGKAVATQAERVKPGTENVSVKARK